MAMKEVIDRYREKGLRLTPQRLAILEFLEGNVDHPTAEDIFHAVKMKYPMISLATIYNTIQALKELGNLQEITIDPERKHYDPNTSPHHHIVCTRCNRIGDVFEDYSRVLSLSEDILKVFKITGNHVDFYGVCIKCQENKKKKEV